MFRFDRLQATRPIVNKDTIMLSGQGVVRQKVSHHL